MKLKTDFPVNYFLKHCNITKKNIHTGRALFWLLYKKYCIKKITTIIILVHSLKSKLSL